MNKKIMYAVGAILIIIIGTLLYVQQKDTNKKVNSETNTPEKTNTDMEAKKENLGTYAYICNDGTEFSATPALDMASLVITPSAKANFSKSTLLHTAGTGARYEGEGLIFIGAGEGVSLTANGATLSCNPKPSTESPPFNFGDSDEGGGVKQNLVMIVGDNLKGKWVSVDDPKFVREFADMGVVWDFYDGKQVTDGRFQIFSKTQPLDVPFTIAENTSYIQIVADGSQTEKLNFKVNKLTPEELELAYMDRGGVLKFKSVK